MFCPYYTYNTDLLWISDVLIVSERAIICLVVFLVQHIKDNITDEASPEQFKI